MLVGLLGFGAQGGLAGLIVLDLFGEHHVAKAGLDGIERELDAGKPNSANLYELSAEERAAEGIELLPGNLLDATRELEKDDVLRKALGTTRDGDYVDYFVKVKRGEWQAAHEQITQWELDRYLSLF